jgi:hypothetical protein
MASKLIKTVKRYVKENEVRVYVDAVSGHRGCRYITGNRWQPKGTIEGTLTAEEWAEARSISVYDGKWTTCYDCNKEPKLVAVTSRRTAFDDPSEWAAMTGRDGSE